MNNDLSFLNFLLSSIIIGTGAVSIPPVLAVNVTGFTGDYASGNWGTSDSAGIGTVSQNASTLDIGLNCDIINGTCPQNFTPVDGNYVERSIYISSQMSGVIQFDWTFDYADNTIEAGYVLNTVFIPIVSGDNNSNSQSSSTAQTVIVNANDTFGFFVEAYNGATGGTSGNFHISSFKVKDIPFEFNPLQGVALGLPLFLGLRILKKRRNHKLQSSK